MTKLFISHSSKDNGFVRDLREALADHGQDGWIDSRELRGGDPLWHEIQKAIDDASAFFKTAFGGVWLEFVDIRFNYANPPECCRGQTRRARRVITTFAYDPLNRVTQNQPLRRGEFVDILMNRVETASEQGGDF